MHGASGNLAHPHPRLCYLNARVIVIAGHSPNCNGARDVLEAEAPTRAVLDF